MQVFPGHLSVLIPLLYQKIEELKAELTGPLGSVDALTDEQMEERTELQLMIHQYDRLLDYLREGYVAALADGTQLPSYEQLIAGITRRKQ